MKSRERVLKTFRFQKTDRPPIDLMEGLVWPELLEYFNEKYGFETQEQVLDFLETDFRWTTMSSGKEWESRGEFGKAHGPLAGASSIDDIGKYCWPDPNWWQPDDYKKIRSENPDKAIVFWPGWIPNFWNACEAFGTEDALVKMVLEPDIFDAFMRRHHRMCMDIITRGVVAAKGFCDTALLGDDFAGQESLLMSPDDWRRMLKPYYAEQVKLIRDNGMYVMFHSCGAVRPILDDLIEIGVNALLVFQTNAKGMDPGSISKEFGGRLGFYGGIDVQHLLSYGTPEEVQKTVASNINYFKDCGGYIVANSHNGLYTIKGENIECMLDFAKNFRY